MTYVQLPGADSKFQTIDVTNRKYCQEILMRIGTIPITYTGIQDLFAKSLIDFQQDVHYAQLWQIDAAIQEDLRKAIKGIHDNIAHLDDCLCLLQDAGCIRKLE